MVQLVTTRTFSPRVKRPCIPRTTFPFIAFRELAGYFSCVLSICSDSQKMSDIYFHTDVTLVDGSILQGGKWPCVPWYPDTLEAGAATQDLSWFIEIHHALFPRVHAIQDFPYPNRLHLAHHIRLQRTSDKLPLWGAYVEYPLPTEQGTCPMATGISEKMGGPHVEDSLSPWTWTKPPNLNRLCPYCNKSHNSRDSLMNHI